MDIMSVKPVPDGYSTATPYLIVSDAATALDFYKSAFGAAEIMRFAMPGGKLGHAEIQLGNSRIMLADEFPEMGYVGPSSLGGTPVSIHLYVDDADSLFNRAVGAGAQVLRPMKDEFYGDRTGTLKDPFGHMWSVASHKENVSVEELHRRMSAMKPGGGQG
jgi:PhnB protein